MVISSIERNYDERPEIITACSLIFNTALIAQYENILFAIQKMENEL